MAEGSGSVGKPRHPKKPGPCKDWILYSTSPVPSKYKSLMKVSQSCHYCKRSESSEHGGSENGEPPICSDQEQSLNTVPGRCTWGSWDGGLATRQLFQSVSSPLSLSSYASARPAGEGFGGRIDPPATQPSWGHCPWAQPSPAPILARAQWVSARLAQAPVPGREAPSRRLCIL